MGEIEYFGFGAKKSLAKWPDWRILQIFQDFSLERFGGNYLILLGVSQIFQDFLELFKT